MATLLPSLSSDEEIPAKDDSSDDEVDRDFEFGGILGEDGGLASGLQTSSEGWSFQDALKKMEGGSSTSLSQKAPRMDVASLITAKRRTLKKQSNESDKEEEQKDESETEDSDLPNKEDGGENDESSGGEEEESESDSESDSDAEVDDADREMEQDVLKTRAGDDAEARGSEEDSDEDEEEEEEAKAAAYFETSTNTQNQDEIEVFAQLALSRPLLRGVAAMGFVKPTPIQSAVIPVALAGRDVCASAVTGSGKTAAFLLPILERLLHRSQGRTKAIVLAPTRELAAQCLGMMGTLSKFTELRSALIVGGAKNVKAQAAELRARPDIVIATPGRLLDHVLNTSAFTLDDIEFMVLDEADRLLDLGFQEEVHEIVKALPVERQTLLFSATMNTKVDDLVKLSLKRPVRVHVSDKDQGSKKKQVEVAPRLEQEFIRVRGSQEGLSREGMLLALLTRTFKDQTIVFFETKSSAHRLMILCGLCGIKCAELHGNLTQTQRLTALEKFRNGEVDVLLATDLAARGLDIDQVKTVINFEMPSQVTTYIHRIGRTARAGRGGKSCTLIGEGRRHLMKELIKDAEEKGKATKPKNSKGSLQTGVIRSRTIPPAVIAHFANKIESLEPHVKEIRQAEAVARMDRLAEMEAMRAQNMIEHSSEIQSRPQREWFASNQQKQLTKEALRERQKMIAEKVGTGTHRMSRKKRRAREAREMLESGGGDDSGNEESAPKRAVSIKSAARAHKKEQEQRENEKYSQSIEESFAKRKKKRKGATASDAAGDSSLFQEEKVTYGKKPKKDEETRVESSYHFRGYDPSKFDHKKPKKKAVNKFKSKSKYKRRK